MKKSAEYWQRYRRVGNSVAKKLSNISSDFINSNKFDSDQSDSDGSKPLPDDSDLAYDLTRIVNKEHMGFQV